MPASDEIAGLAENADTAVREAMHGLARARRRATDALGFVTLINSGKLGDASAALRVALRDFDNQTTMLERASADILSYRQDL